VCPGADSMSVFARLLLHNTPAFLQLFRTAGGMPEFAAVVAAGGGEPAQALLLALLDLWLDKTDAIGASCFIQYTSSAWCA